MHLSYCLKCKYVINTNEELLPIPVILNRTFICSYCPKNMQNWSGLQLSVVWQQPVTHLHNIFSLAKAHEVWILNNFCPGETGSAQRNTGCSCPVNSRYVEAGIVFRWISPTAFVRIWMILSCGVATTLCPLISMMRCPTRIPPLSAIPPRIRLQIMPSSTLKPSWNFGSGLLIIAMVTGGQWTILSLTYFLLFWS